MYHGKILTQALAIVSLLAIVLSAFDQPAPPPITHTVALHQQ